MTVSSRADRVSRLGDVMASEWVKLRSVRSTWWAVGSGAALMVLWVVIFGLSASASHANGELVPAMTPIETASGGMLFLGQLALAILASFAIAGEYATGSILTTLQCVPQRLRLLAGKAAVIAPVLFVTGAGMALLGSAVAAPILDDVNPGMGAGELFRGVLVLAFYSAVVGIVVLGVGTVLRSVAGTLGFSMLVLLVLPMAFQGSGVELLLTIANYFPGPAGMALLGGEGPDYSPLAAVAILAAWCAASLAAGSAVFRRRDAI